MMFSFLQLLWHLLVITGFIYLFSWNLFFTFQEIKRKHERKKHGSFKVPVETNLEEGKDSGLREVEM